VSDSSSDQDVREDADSVLSSVSFHDSIYEEFQKEHEEELHASKETPHHTRSRPVNHDPLFSPGAFFARKSGNLGALGESVDPEQRVSVFLELFIVVEINDIGAADLVHSQKGRPWKDD
jgi:hypothetical protein